MSAVKSPLENSSTERIYHSRHRCCGFGVCRALNHLIRQAFEFTLRLDKRSDLIERSWRANAGYIATKQFRARQFHVEVKRLQQIYLAFIEAICVAGISVGSEKPVEIGSVFVRLSAAVRPC